jgi:hypothetical protein
MKASYGSVTDDRGNVISVRNSSASEQPRAWVFIRDRDGSVGAPCGDTPDGVRVPVPHLAAAQARELAAALLRFADDAEGTAPSAVSALELAAQECEAEAARYVLRASEAGDDRVAEIMRAFAANHRHVAARIRAIPHLAKGGPL